MRIGLVIAITAAIMAAAPVGAQPSVEAREVAPPDGLEDAPTVGGVVAGVAGETPPPAAIVAAAAAGDDAGTGVGETQQPAKTGAPTPPTPAPAVEAPEQSGAEAANAPRTRSGRPGKPGRTGRAGRDGRDATLPSGPATWGRDNVETQLGPNGLMDGRRPGATPNDGEWASFATREEQATMATRLQAWATSVFQLKQPATESAPQGGRSKMEWYQIMLLVGVPLLIVGMAAWLICNSYYNSQPRGRRGVTAETRERTAVMDPHRVLSGSFYERDSQFDSTRYAIPGQVLMAEARALEAMYAGNNPTYIIGGQVNGGNGGQSDADSRGTGAGGSGTSAATTHAPAPQQPQPQPQPGPTPGTGNGITFEVDKKKVTIKGAPGATVAWGDGGVDTIDNTGTTSHTYKVKATKFVAVVKDSGGNIIMVHDIETS